MLQTNQISANRNGSNSSAVNMNSVYMSSFKFIAKFLLLVTAILFLTGASYSQLFLKSYDFPPTGTRTEYGYSIERNFDGTVAGRWSVAGVSNSTPNAGSFDWMFLKLTNSGSVSCARLLGFTLADSCFSHLQFSGSSRLNVLAGFYRVSNGREKASFSMLDTNCMHILSKQISDSLRHEYRQVVKNPSDVFTMAGYIQSYIPTTPPSYQNHILASQYSPAGALMWAFNYTPPFPWVDEKAYSICYQPTDGSYAITGITNRFTGAAGPYQIFVMKVSAAGIPMWFKGYSPMPGTPSEGRKIIAMPDGGFVITGSSTAVDPASDIYVFRISATGTAMWSNTYGMPGASERSFSIIYRSTDVSLVFTGSTMLPGATEDIILTKISAATGAHFWTRRYPNTSGIDRGYDLKEATTPVGLGVTGRISSTTSDDPFFLKTDVLGIVSSVCQDSLIYQPRPGLWNDSCQRNIMQLSDITIQPQVTNPTVVEKTICGTTTGVTSNNEIANKFTLKQNYPNPFNPSTIIEFSVPSAGDVSITVFDAAGREVAVLVNGHRERGNYAVQFSAVNLSSGIYFYKLKSEGFEETKKMLMVK